MSVTIDTSKLIDEIRQVVKEELGNFASVSIISNPNKPVTTEELSKYLNVTEPTILRWRKKGKIPFYCIGSAVRFDLDKVIKALEK